MVEKQKIEKKIGEVLGLEISAQKSIEQLSSKGLLDTARVNKDKIEEIKREAADHQRRIEQVVTKLSQAQGFDSQKILKEADDTVQRTTQMMDVYLKGHEEPTAAFEFLCQAEAGEVTHYELLNHMTGQQVNDPTFSSEVRSILDEEKQHLQECIQAAKESLG
jgi:O6-methylguanine-DNA--protein-cysteine methyltransferase